MGNARKKPGTPPSQRAGRAPSGQGWKPVTPPSREGRRNTPIRRPGWSPETRPNDVRSITPVRDPFSPPELDLNDVRSIAMYEAGHAVSAVVNGHGLRRVDIERRRLLDGRLSVGRTGTAPVDLKALRGKGGDAALPHLVQSLVGPLSELLVNPAAMYSTAFDSDLAACGLYAAMAFYGDVEMEISPAELSEKGGEIEALMERAHGLAEDLVLAHLDAIREVADLLVARGSLTGEEVSAVVGRGVPR